MIIILILREIPNARVQTQEVPTAPQLPLPNPLIVEPPSRPIMNMIIWNCRGTHNEEFRHQFRALLDNHRHVLAVLLETHMQDHSTIRDNFYYTNMS